MTTHLDWWCGGTVVRMRRTRWGHHHLVGDGVLDCGHFNFSLWIMIARYIDTHVEGFGGSMGVHEMESGWVASMVVDQHRSAGEGSYRGEAEA